ncbi:hypothetical protein [Paraburkholderia dipogonis]|jgi:hypothetical protein|uniref:hypothetical protein n=1 Tax=Paraburkholderia dipogonis TaxID=1211383 RepID=UPI0038B94937
MKERPLPDADERLNQSTEATLSALIGQINGFIRTAVLGSRCAAKLVDCAPPGSDLVDHREGIGKPAVGAKELSATPKPQDIFGDSWRGEGRLLHETGINPVSEVLQ